ncbi:MAG: cytochrome C oxidase subunit IV family protein [Phycisphaeraceae bacterium]|nr:cytochrome C oxidase subunit IV family protein [Phycisphaeraceae bacterium]
MSHPVPAHDPYEPIHDNPHAHHGHFILPASTLLAVFIALLALTGLTVGAAKLEMLYSQAFGIEVKGWVNVLIALSIATIKTAFVVGFFMQLRYDNPLNTMVFLFTIVCVLTFFGFTMADIGGRGSTQRSKAVYVVPGGTGLAGGGPITKTAREKAIIDKSPLLQPLHAEHREFSNANRSRPVTGLTLPGFADPGHADEHHAQPAAGGH